MPTELVLDVLLAVLLAVTAGYCFLLNRRLQDMRNGSDGMREIVRELNEAVSRAHAGVEQLRDSSSLVANDIAGKLRAGRDLAGELAMMIDSGNNIADRMTASITASRHTARKPDPLEALTRLDKTFAGASSPAHERPGREQPAQPEKEAAAGRELRQALRSVR